MGTFEKFSFKKNFIGSESLRIDSKKGKISFAVNGYRFIDNDTKQTVIYVPSFDITGYGENGDKADEMIKFSMEELFRDWIKMSQAKMLSELYKLGWRKGIFNKIFSRAYVDNNGELQNFNAENNKVERISLTAA